MHGQYIVFPVLKVLQENKKDCINNQSLRQAEHYILKQKQSQENCTKNN